jgi:hypothetical protein
MTVISKPPDILIKGMQKDEISETVNKTADHVAHGTGEDF